MKRLALLIALALPLLSLATSDDIGGPQGEAEKSLQSVVRNKRYFKTGKFEITGMAGVMPYDSVLNGATIGGRGLYHFNDHWAWEILDAQMVFSSFSGYPFNSVAGGAAGITDMEAVQLRQIIGTGIQMSPIYGKIRFFGSQVLYFDMYGSLELGVANTSTHKYSGTAGSINDSVIQSGLDPMGAFGIGFKLFLNSAMSLNVDLRDYLVLAPVYGGSAIRSNYTFFLGLSFFFPTFG